MVRTLSVVAVGLIILGVVAMSGPMFGFSTVASDRGISINVASGQDDAFLGIEEEEDQITPNQESEILHLIDNGIGIDSTDDIKRASVIAFDGDDDPDFDINVVGENDEVIVEVGCGSEGNGPMTFDIEVDAEASVSTIYETDADIDVNCAGGDRDAQLNVTSVEYEDEGFVEFIMENEGEDNLRFEAISVTEMDTASEITDNREITVSAEEGESRTASSDNDWTEGEDQELEGQGPGVEIETGDKATVTIDRFNDNLDGNTIEVQFIGDRGNDPDVTVEVDIPS
jgi:hypothetical protein